tara:strand:+ start:155 stop:337 length:183 start_codon:yes stop_codon:yes gene_type:complete
MNSIDYQKWFVLTAERRSEEDLPPEVAKWIDKRLEEIDETSKREATYSEEDDIGSGDTLT